MACTSPSWKRKRQVIACSNGCGALDGDARRVKDNGETALQNALMRQGFHQPFQLAAAPFCMDQDEVDGLYLTAIQLLQMLAAALRYPGCWFYGEATGTPVEKNPSEHLQTPRDYGVGD